jgi:hypothetical protein
LAWGAFKKQMPPAEYKKILAEFMADNPKPKQDDPFDARECVPKYADGDYPDWLQQEMLKWFPDELVSKCRASKESVHNGEFVSLPADKAEAIAERLREMGYTVQHRPDLTFY